MKTTRRVFLKSGAMALVAAGVAPAFGPAWLKSTVFADEPKRNGKSASGKKTLICIFQRGAVDGLSMVVPHGDPFYYQHRSVNGIAIARTGDAGVLDLDGTFGLNPNLKPLHAIYQSGHMAAIQAVGSPSPTRSHFDAQDFMEAAMLDKSSREGWLARVLENCPEDAAKRAVHTQGTQAQKAYTGAFRGVAMTGQVPRSLMGFPDALAIPNLGTFDVKGDMVMMGGPKRSASDGFESLYDGTVGDVLHGTGQETFEALKQLRSITSQKYSPANGAIYPNGKFGEALRQIAQLIKADVGLEVGFAESGGWDTHAQQGGAQGRLARNLQEFGQGLAALYTDLGDRMNDVVILTMSEFGRTVRQNGNNGTDHGHGTCFLVLGGDVNGGKVLGKWPGLAPEQLNENRDLAVTTDFRDIFAEVAQKQMGVRDLKAVFPNYEATPAKFRGVLKV
jgi:uncharacterized protein (DUF1501 family)